MMETKLKRQLSFQGLIATGICSMLGASIYLIPFMIHRNIPGIGPYVLPAFVIAAIPAIFAALAYAMLASAMPRAGGAYVYASRGLSPYLGFIASFAQWFGLSIAIGVISYVIVPFVRDIFVALSWQTPASVLEWGWVRVGLALMLLWGFVFVNLKGLTFYQKIIIPMMILMFALGFIGIITGFYFDHDTFLKSTPNTGDMHLIAPFQWHTLLSASAILMSSFIGFDSIAQAGGEVKNPGKWLPRAIILCMLIVCTFYFLFTAAIYHTVPWQYVAQQALEKDITAPGLLTNLLPPYLTVLLVAGAAIALINDLPAMFLSVSRLVYAWSLDRVFPRQFSQVNMHTHVPSSALVLSGVMATIGVLGSHFSGDFFLGVDILMTSMLLNFILMCLTVIKLPNKNPALAEKINLFSASARLTIAWIGLLLLSIFYGLHIYKDMVQELDAWYFHSTIIWILVMALGSLVFIFSKLKLEKSGVDLKAYFNKLPEE